IHLDDDLHVDRFAFELAGDEAPQLCSLDGFLVEAEGGIEGARDVAVGRRAVGADDAVDPGGALNLCAHRVGGVLRLHLFHHTRIGDAAPELIDAAARATAGAGAEARAGSGSAARTGSCAASAAGP